MFGVRLTCGPAVTVPDLRGMMAAAENGAGVTVLPRYLCQEALDRGRLVALLEPEEPPVNTMYLVRRTGVPGNAHLDRVHRHLVSAARDW